MNKLKLYQDPYLDLLRKSGDPLGDSVAEFLYQQPDWILVINSWKSIPSKNELVDLPLILQDFFSLFLQNLEGIQEDKIRMAQDFFSDQGSLYLSLLGFYSLPYCYAFADGAQVLVRSKRITSEVGMRLTETALFLLDSFRPGTFLGDQQAMLTMSKVRLIHAFSRFFIVKYAQDWDSSWGVPINQEDMLGTNLAFSLLVMRGLEKIGRYPGKKISEAILYYWKVMGFYLGIDIAYWPETSKEAFELEKIIRKRHLKPSEAGRTLIKSLLAYYQDSINDGLLAQQTASLVAYFIGDQASEVLGIQSTLKIPKEVYGLFLDLSFIRQYGPGNSYEKTRRIFFEQSRAQFGDVPKLQLPERKRS